MNSNIFSNRKIWYLKNIMDDYLRKSSCYWRNWPSWSQGINRTNRRVNLLSIPSLFQLPWKRRTPRIWYNFLIRCFYYFICRRVWDWKTRSGTNRILSRESYLWKIRKENRWNSYLIVKRYHSDKEDVFYKLALPSYT